MQESMKLTYKCVKSILPRASTHIFIKHKDTGELKFKSRVQDEERQYASGYVTTYGGDSGSPYWKTDASNRAILIAIVSSKVGPKYEPRSSVSEDPEKQCTNKASKLTEAIVSWIKQHAEIRSIGTKRARVSEKSNQSKSKNNN